MTGKPADSYELRKGSILDLPAIWDVLKAARLDGIPRTDAKERELGNAHPDPKNVHPGKLFVLTKDDTVIGFAALGSSRATTGCEMHMVLHPDHENETAYAVLVKGMEEHARKEGGLEIAIFGKPPLASKFLQASQYSPGRYWMDIGSGTIARIWGRSFRPAPKKDKDKDKDKDIAFIP